MLGYWDDDGGHPLARSAATAGCTPATSAARDEQGRIRLSSRRSDLIIRGGENVYPAEVEAC